MSEIRRSKDDGDDSVTVLLPEGPLTIEAQKAWGDKPTNAMLPAGRTPLARWESKTLPVNPDDMPILEITGASGQPQPSPSNQPSDVPCGDNQIPPIKPMQLDPDFQPRGMDKVGELPKPTRPGDRTEARDSKSPESMTEEEIARTHAERLAKIEEDKFFRLAQIEQEKAARLTAIENERVAMLRSLKLDKQQSRGPDRADPRDILKLIEELNGNKGEVWRSSPPGLTEYSRKTGK